MAKESSAKEAATFLKYIESRKILIADTSSASRSGLFKVFHELGAKTSNLILVNSFASAQTAIIEKKPQIVVTEYDLGKKCGLELLQSQREQRPKETKECIFVIVAGNTSQSAVARSAEEEIDAYIIKPYTAEVVRKVIIQAAVLKIKPPAYLVAIEAGKKALLESNFAEAKNQFKRALDLDKSPALAHYYAGLLEHLQKILDAAEGNYSQGLQYNRIHYKCLVGLYDLLMQEQRPHEAYEVVKKISQYFPANPKRLAEVLRLAIVTNKFEDIEKYYSIFVNLDERDDKLIRYVCAALVVCGKYYLSTKLGNARAIELFRKAAATSSGRTKILIEIINTLLEYNLAREAKEFLDKFPPESFNSNEFLLLRFIITNSQGNISTIIDQGRALIAKGVQDEKLFTIMIKRSLESKSSALALDQILHQAITAFPDKKKFFESLVPEDKKLA